MLEQRLLNARATKLSRDGETYFGSSTFRAFSDHQPSNSQSPSRTRQQRGILDFLPLLKGEETQEQLGTRGTEPPLQTYVTQPLLSVRVPPWGFPCRPAIPGPPVSATRSRASSPPSPPPLPCQGSQHIIGHPGSNTMECHCPGLCDVPLGLPH